MATQSAVEAALVAALVVAVIGAWDGLVRHHIRYVHDGLQLHLNLRGLPATALGALSLSLVVLIGRFIIVHTRELTAPCHSPFCAASIVILPLIEWWPGGVGVLAFVIMFAWWAFGASVPSGPYRQLRLAPNTWISEKEVVSVVSEGIRAAGIPAIHENDILEMASWVRRNLALFLAAAPEETLLDGRIDVNAVVEVLANGLGAQRFLMDHITLHTAISAIVQCYADRYPTAPPRQASNSE